MLRPSQRRSDLPLKHITHLHSTRALSRATAPQMLSSGAPHAPTSSGTVIGWRDRVPEQQDSAARLARPARRESQHLHERRGPAVEDRSQRGRRPQGAAIAPPPRADAPPGLVPRPLPQPAGERGPEQVLGIVVRHERPLTPSITDVTNSSSTGCGGCVAAESSATAASGASSSSASRSALRSNNPRCTSPRARARAISSSSRAAPRPVRAGSRVSCREWPRPSEARARSLRRMRGCAVTDAGLTADTGLRRRRAPALRRAQARSCDSWRTRKTPRSPVRPRAAGNLERRTAATRIPPVRCGAAPAGCRRLAGSDARMSCRCRARRAATSRAAPPRSRR